MDDFPRRLAEAKSASFIQSLLRAARLLDELGLARKPRRVGPRPRAAHRALYPHIGLEGTRPSVIAAALGITPQAVAQLVRDLEAMEVVERVPDPIDGRARLVRFTDLGQQDILDGFGVLAGIEADVAARMGEEDVRALHRLLVRLEAVAVELRDGEEDGEA